MVAVLVILDGASEPLRGGAPSSLEAARTPALDALARGGRLSRLRTVAPGLPPGSESGIPALLGWTPPAPVDRGAIEAAAHGVRVRPGERAWRVDVLDRAGGRAHPAAVAQAARHLQAAAPLHRVHPLHGHRLLLVGPPPLPELCRSGSLRGTRNDTALWVWPEGVVPAPVLDARTVVVGAAGAAVGIGRSMGARTVVPAGASGGVDTDLAAKAGAALDAIRDGGAARVVVHVGAPDEAAHLHDAAAKVAAIERADRELIAPLAEAVRRVGATLRVCPDHGCDPCTGEHDGAPVPCLDWPGGGGGGRLTERAVAELPVVELAVRVAVAA